MNWRPDWNKPRFAVNIIADNDEHETSFYPVEVVEEGDGLYRLMDHPFTEAEVLRWGDLIRAERLDEQTLKLIELVAHSDHYHDKKCDVITHKRHARLYMDAIMQAGGFWVMDMMLGPQVFIPPDFDVAQWEAENQDKLQSNEVFDTD